MQFVVIEKNVASSIHNLFIQSAQCKIQVPLNMEDISMQNGVNTCDDDYGSGNLR